MLSRSNVYLTMNTIINMAVGMCVFLFNILHPGFGHLCRNMEQRRDEVHRQDRR